MQYSKVQSKAINHKSGNMRIIACAGSGKTEVISRRVATLIHNGIDPAKIVCFTFTEKAAEEMKNRVHQHLLELCPSIPVGDLYIGTIHSFCFFLLRNYSPKYANYDILDENKRIALLAKPEIYHRLALENLASGKSKFNSIVKFCESVDIIREECIAPKALSKEKYLLFSYKKYEDLLDDLRFLDFSGILSRCFNMLKHEEELAKIRSRYKFLVVDEYQDINNIQERIIKKIWGGSANICVVGDDDQSIFHWRGSDLSNILTFEGRYPSVTTHVLSDNYRSTEEIVSTASRVIVHNRRRIEKPIQAIRLDKGNVETHSFQSDLDEARFIVQKIDQLMDHSKNQSREIGYSDFAVLFRSVRNSASPLVKQFRANNIPFCIKGTTDLFECLEIDLVAKCYAFFSGLKYKQISIKVNDLLLAYESAFGKGGANRFLTNMKKLKAYVSESNSLDIQRMFHIIVKSIDTEKLTESIMWNLGRFSQLISDFESIFSPIRSRDLKFFLGFIEGFAYGNYEGGSGEDPTLLDAVFVSTIHRAKGMEFKHVFVPTLTHGIFPSRRRPPQNFLPQSVYPEERYRGDLEDERRLFYVAMARARDGLFVSFPLSKNNVNKKPSRFVFELEEAMKSFTAESVEPTSKSLEISKSGYKHQKVLHMSFSQIGCYLRCPFEFKLRHVFGFNPGIEVGIGFGKQVHFLLNFLHKDFKEKPSFENVEQLVDKMFFLRYSTGKAFQNMKKKALKIIWDYVQQNEEIFGNVIFAEKPFAHPIRGIDFFGIADLITKRDKGSIELMDFKTEVEAKPNPIYELQLRAYAIALNGAMGLDISNAFVYFLQTGNKFPVSLVAKHINETKDILGSVAESLHNRRFPPNKNQCASCDFKAFCPNLGLGHSPK